MNILVLLKKLAIRLERKNNSLFTYPVDKQKLYIESLGTPNNDIERAYFQYKCQQKFNKSIINYALNMVSFPVICVILLKNTAKPNTEHQCDAIFFADGKPENIVPTVLRNKYPNWLTIDNKKEYLSKTDKQYFYNVARIYPFSWHFLLKCLIKIRFYSYEIEAHNPKAFIVCNEYSFTSSLLTDYCKSKNLQHINVMHGEKLYYMRDSYFRFDECYVWGQPYVDLFVKLKADPSQFVVAVPDSLLFKNSGFAEKQYDYTYYLAAENNEVLKKIIEILNMISKKGYHVAIRPHPRYSNIEDIKKRAKNITIEDLSTVSIEESILRTKNAISRYSTVLNQAANNGTNVVIDDITQPNSFKKLENLEYVMLSMDHMLLSEIID